jgi:phosphoglycolate phosphatase-like HAD superfamily hydrolase
MPFNFSMTNREIRNVLWTMHGTLFDTYPAVTYSLSRALNGMGFSIALNVIDGLVRQSFDDCMETFCRRFKLDPGLLRQQFSEFYRTIPPANQSPFPGAREICEFIHRQRGLNILFKDNSLEAGQQLIEVHGFSSLIDDIFSVEVAYRDPPEPSLLFAVLKNHSLDPAETLLIGSRNTDIQAGQAAGVCTCLFGKAELTTLADMQIENHSQLLDLLTNRLEKPSKASPITGCLTT